MYDLSKLSRADLIDTRKALTNFDSLRDYFDELSIFVNESDDYMSEYVDNPLIAINSQDSRMFFLEELEELRKKFSMLGMKNAGYLFRDMREAVRREDLVDLMASLLKFRELVDRISTHIRNSEKSNVFVGGEKSGKQIILAVDDRPELLTSVVNMLSDYFKVMAVTSGASALKVIDKYTPALFLLDIEMPGMNGYELAKHIRSTGRFENTPIIFLTAKGSREYVISAVKNGGNDYIVKPVDREMLITKIENHLGFLW